MLLADMRERACRRRVFSRGLLSALWDLYRGTGSMRNLLHAMQTVLTREVYLLFGSSSSNVSNILIFAEKGHVLTSGVFSSCSEYHKK